VAGLPVVVTFVITAVALLADGHVSVLGSCGVAALDWLVAHV
jgi:hypothetical protein